MATPQAARSLPAFLRQQGGVRVVVAATARGSAAMEVAESGGYRVRFPASAGACEGVLINTGGGLAGGDRMRVDATTGPGAQAVLTSQAAEKVYRSDGEDTEVAIRLALGPGSRLDWLPQEQILFDRARVRRNLAVEMAPDATLTLVESTVFGRLAAGERVAEGAFRDSWRIRRGGRLVFAEEVRLDGPVDAVLARKAVARGGRAIATFVHVAPGAGGRREEARAALEGAASECGVSAWDGILLARFLSQDPQALRADLARFVSRLRGAPMPRSWQT